MSAEQCREKILSQDYMDFISPGYWSGEDIIVRQDQSCIQQMGFGYRAVYVEKGLAGELSLERYGYQGIPGCYTLIDTSALNEAGISAVQNYPALHLRGRDIMIGFIDTGIDYENVAFRNLAGGTRIAGIWDQTIQTGNPPEGIPYGSEYTEDMINEALRSDDPLAIVPSKDEHGHGTFLASVAAGGVSTENQFSGAAPEAVLGVVKLKEAKNYLKDFYGIYSDAPCYQENDIMFGLKYLHELAAKKGLPIVICIALGTNMGPHNGASLLSQMIDAYANLLNHCVVIGGGNEASNRHHYYGEVEEKGPARETEIRVEKGTTGFVAELWSQLPNIGTTYLVSPSGEKSPTLSLRQGSKFNLGFVFDGTEVEIEYRLLLENSNSQLIFFRFKGAAEGIWKIGVEPVYIVKGGYHIWLPVKEFLESDVYFLEANADTTLTEPGSTRDAMTISYYNSVDNSIDINSGRGYTRCTILKPDFAVPGVEITGLSLDGRFVERSGSSASVGIAAGSAALIMEWLGKQPAVRGITCSQVRNIILFGTNQREDMDYPNKEWGYGTIDIYQSLNRLREL